MNRRRALSVLAGYLGVGVGFVGAANAWVLLAARSGVREVAARVKGVQQSVFRPSVLLGPEHPISGNGRSSWGPPDPLAPRSPGS